MIINLYPPSKEDSLVEGQNWDLSVCGWELDLELMRMVYFGLKKGWGWLVWHPQWWKAVTPTNNQVSILVAPVTSPDMYK